jgi:hypothetical protein
MITIAFHDAGGTLVNRLSVRSREEEAEAFPTLIKQLESQMGWNSRLPGHSFSTQPMIGPGHKRRVMYFIGDQLVGWYIYHDDEMTTDAPTYDQLRQWLRHYRKQIKDANEELIASYTPEQQAIVQRIEEARDQARLCQEWMLPSTKSPEQLKWPKPPEGLE